MILFTGAELGLVCKSSDGGECAQVGILRAKAETVTEKCAATIVKEKHSELAKQNAVNASLRS